MKFMSMESIEKAWNGGSDDEDEGEEGAKKGSDWYINWLLPVY